MLPLQQLDGQFSLVTLVCDAIDIYLMRLVLVSKLLLKNTLVSIY